MQLVRSQGKEGARKDTILLSPMDAIPRHDTPCQVAALNSPKLLVQTRCKRRKVTEKRRGKYEEGCGAVEPRACHKAVEDDETAGKVPFVPSYCAQANEHAHAQCSQSK